jgi:hypothetical protein
LIAQQLEMLLGEDQEYVRIEPGQDL